jgi:hypothetical protein
VRSVSKDYAESVPRFLHLAAFLVLCFAGLSPAMLCIVPDAPMSVSERACCRQMAGQCGQMDMPASHGCCQKSPAGTQPAILHAELAVFHPATLSPLGLPVSEVPTSAPIPGAWMDAPDHAPPKTPASPVSNLRI